MRGRAWHVILSMLALSVAVGVAIAMPRTLKEWNKCRDKAAASVDQRMVGVVGVEVEIQEQCGTPPVNEAGTNSGVGVHPYDLVRSKRWKQKFVRITQGRYQAFVDRLVVAGNTRLEGGWIIGEGMAPHSGGADAAAFAIHAASGEVFAVMIEDSTRLSGFGFGSSWEGAPKALQTWVRERGGSEGEKSRPTQTQPPRQLTPDEAAMVLGTLIVARDRCSVTPANKPLNVEIAKLGQDLNDFLPNARYAPLVEVKVKKANEFIAAQGKGTACQGMVEVLKRFLPALYP